jgi:hypothetical protein
MPDDFVPEADAAEQDREVDPHDVADIDAALRDAGATEADPADALEQAQVVPDDEGYEAS